MPYIGRDLNRGNYLKIDDISSSFNSSTTTFNLTVGGSAFTPGSAFAILVSVGGVIQEPESAYQVNNSEITFANAPTAQDSFFCIALGVALGIGVPGNGTVNGTQMAKPFNYDGFFYLNDSSNRVGINSSIPTAALDVDGIIKASSFTGGSGGINVGVGTFTGLDVNGNGDISGNLVLGGDLTVNGTTSTIDTNLIGVDRVEVGANSSTIAGIAVTQSGTADLVRLYDGASQVVTIDDEGNVGINSTVPTQKLDIIGNIKAGGDINFPTSMDSTESGGVAVQRFWSTGTITNGNVYKCGRWNEGEAAVQLLINVRSETGGHSGTATYLWQGGFLPIGGYGVTRLFPLTSGNGHGDGPDDGLNTGGFGVLIKQYDNYTFEVWVYVPSGKSNKALKVAVTELNRGNNFTDISTSAAIPSVNAGYHNSLKTTAIQKLYFKDNHYAYFGDSQDLQLWHSGSHSYIKDAGTGSLLIQGNQIALQDTGGNNHIITNAGTDVQLYYDFANNSTPKLKTTSTGAQIDTILSLYGTAGNPGRLRLQEGGAISEIIGTRNSDANSDLQFKTEMGDGTQVRAKINYSGDFVVPSNKVGIGTDNPGQALEVYGTGTSTVAEVNGTGRYRGFEIHEAGTRKAYFFHDATNNEAILNTAEPTLQFHIGDTPVMKLDSNGDLVFKDGSAQGNSLSSKITVTDSSNNIQYEIGMLSTSNEDLYFSNSRNSNIRFRTQGNTRWKIDGTGHLLPETAGAVNIGSASAEIGDVYLGSSKFLYFGDNQNLQIHHTNGGGGQSYIKNKTGDLTFLTTDTGEFAAQFRQHSSVDLYYDHSKKFATSGIGVTVFGEVAASQDYPITKPVLDFNFAAEKKLDPRFQFTRESIATFIDKKGIVRYSSENQPRFDHHPTSGVSLGLLLEREQQNYQEYSVLMSQSNIKNNITVTDNFAISPDGTQNASKIVNATSNNAQTNIAWNGASVASGSYAMWSIWVKSEETSCILQFFSNTYIFGADRINIELADGTYDGTSASSTFRFHIEKYPNKWWRISVGGNGVNSAGGWYVGVVDSKTAARGATCGSATNKTWFAWGVQEEISIHSRIATSYIPTNGAAVLRKGDRATMDGDDFDDFFDRFQGTIVNEHSNALQSMEGGGSGWEFNNDQLQVNLISQTGSGYAHSHYPGCQASVFGDRNSGGSGGSGSPGTDYLQVYGPNSTIVNGGIQNGAANSGYGRYPGNTGGVPDYTRYYRTWTDAMSYDLTPSTNVLRTATGGATTEGTNTQSISLANVSKFELGNDATDLLYSNFYGRIKRWVYYDKVLPLSQLANLTSQLPQSYL